MKQNKKQKNSGNSYPVIIEIPENYWTYSHNNIEYVYKEN